MNSHVDSSARRSELVADLVGLSEEKDRAADNHIGNFVDERANRVLTSDTVVGCYIGFGAVNPDTPVWNDL